MVVLINGNTRLPDFRSDDVEVRVLDPAGARAAFRGSTEEAVPALIRSFSLEGPLGEVISAVSLMKCLVHLRLVDDVLGVVLLLSPSKIHLRDLERGVNVEGKVFHFPVVHAVTSFPLGGRSCEQKC